MELTCKFIAKGHQAVMLGDSQVGEARKRDDDVWMINAEIANRPFNTKSYRGLTNAMEKLNFRVNNPGLTNDGLETLLNGNLLALAALTQRRLEITRKIDEEINDLSRNIDHLKNELIDITWPDVDDLDIGGHECKESVLGVCVYDAIEDPSWDSCLVCGQPNERK